MKKFVDSEFVKTCHEHVIYLEIDIRLLVWIFFQPLVMAVEVLHKTISQLSGNLCRFWFGFSCTCNQINGASAILGLKSGPWSASGSTSSLYKKLLLLLKAEGNF